MSPPDAWKDTPGPKRIPSRDFFDDAVALLQKAEESGFFLVMCYENASIYHHAYTRMSKGMFKVFKKQILDALDKLEKRVGDNWK